MLSKAREQIGKILLQAAAGNDGVRDDLRMRRVVCQRERNEQREVLLLRLAIQTSRQLLQQRPLKIRQNSRAVPVLRGTDCLSRECGAVFGNAAAVRDAEIIAAGTGGQSGQRKRPFFGQAGAKMDTGKAGLSGLLGVRSGGCNHPMNV